MKIARRFKFEAAHRLPNHDGKCRRLHGHTYHLELVFSGQPRKVDHNDPQSGFIVDFGRLRRMVDKELLDPYLDHRDLDQSIPELSYSSAEHISAWIVGWCMTHLEGRKEFQGVRIESARLWETENAWAESNREDAAALGYLHDVQVDA